MCAGRPLILSNRIGDNWTSYHCSFPSLGGGIYSDDTSPVVVCGNLIAGNRCDGECTEGDISRPIGEIEGNTIVRNSAHGPAGGEGFADLGVAFLRNIIARLKTDFLTGPIAVNVYAPSCPFCYAGGCYQYSGSSQINHCVTLCGGDYTACGGRGA